MKAMVSEDERTVQAKRVRRKDSSPLQASSSTAVIISNTGIDLIDHMAIGDTVKVLDQLSRGRERRRGEFLKVLIIRFIVICSGEEADLLRRRRK